MRGRALQLVKAVEDSNGLDAWTSLRKGQREEEQQDEDLECEV